jgi:hypothetical protein
VIIDIVLEEVEGEVKGRQKRKVRYEKNEVEEIIRRAKTL